MSEENILLQKAKHFAFEIIKNNGTDPWGLVNHLPEVEKWGRFLLDKHPEADKDVVLLSSWLHDAGHYPITEIDHAVKSEIITKEFLEKENFNTDKISKVLHCIRAHRCKDVLPETLEAKIIACADSASHLTDVYMYSNMLGESRAKLALEKLERDYRDIGEFPEVEAKLKNIYEAWKKIIVAFIDFKME
jgi:uncharacterized protein